MTATKPTCAYCAGEPEPGWIETPNNGPIVPCPVCNNIPEREREFEAALKQRAARSYTKHMLAMCVMTPVGIYLCALIANGGF